MRYIVLGDIHGNYYALEAVINDIDNMYDQEISGFIFTGDYVGDFPDGSKIVDLIQKLSKKHKVYIVKGNREYGQIEPYLEAVKRGKEPDWNIDSTMGAALLCCRELTREQLEFLSRLPKECIIRNNNKRPIFVKHKMPLEPSELEQVKKEHMLVITAHTHEAHFESKDGITLFNPGSIGLPDEGRKGATYGVIESDEKGDWHLTIRDISYDYQKTIDSLKRNNDLYNRCCEWGKVLELSLLTGINCTSLYMFEVKRLALLVQDAKEKGEKPDLQALTDLSFIFSQNRYGNVNYDGSNLMDMHIEDVGDAYVFGPTSVITSGSEQVKTPIPSKELYKIAFLNIKKAVLLANREIIFNGRHEHVVK